MTIYGIQSCDITRKAIATLKKNKLDFVFHDYRVAGMSADKIRGWINELGLEKVLNKKSATWRNLSEDEKIKIRTVDGAVELMLENNTLIKRPIIERNGKVFVGYDENALKK